MCTDGMEMDEISGIAADGTELPHKPVVHAPTDGPLCVACRELDKSFFDMKCDSCQSLLYDEATTVSELFAILRQWIPQTQQNILVIIEQVHTYINVKKTVVYLNDTSKTAKIMNGDITSAALRQCQRASMCHFAVISCR